MVWWHPVDDQHAERMKIDAEFFPDLPLQGGQRRLVGFAHPARQIPAGLVGRVDQQDPACGVSQQGIGADALSGLASVALGQVRPPCRWVALVQRNVRGHADTPGRAAAA